jgi:hypothetical protein
MYILSGYSVRYCINNRNTLGRKRDALRPTLRTKEDEHYIA